eukprot:TRINITY_DN1361_c0_g1_i1.p1 TRINITY_DN1361_c0_g1~~TRINITY_DN1361_c0_g1_i1.p1  ORF type:complete len:352 (+),score=44.55 TRINITY_DN1361_c0_g1_i1:158-1213(+)
MLKAFVSVLLILGCFFVVAHSQSCVSDPSPPSCSSYVLPDSQIDGSINALCKMMGNMPGCSIDNLCSEQSNLANDRFCIPFSIYKDLCEDMPMKNCSAYLSMCQNGTSVIQCDTQALPLPSSMEISSLITDMCNDMYMDECEQCMTQGESKTNMMSLLDCDMLTVYSNLCLSMPDMSQCQAWKTMCTQIPDWPLCSNQGSERPVPSMKMYFHLGIFDYILFRSWVPRSRLAYAATFLVVVIAQVFHDFLKFLRKKAESKWKQQRNSIQLHDMDSQAYTFVEAPPFNFKVDFARATLHSVEITLGFLIMLVAMTFNLGLFLAIILGSFLGTLIFGRFIYGGGEYQPNTGSCH